MAAVRSSRWTISITTIMVVESGTVVISPPGEAHGFTNRGSRTLRLVAIHGASRFTTEWLAGDEPVWRSKPEG